MSCSREDVVQPGGLEQELGLNPFASVRVEESDGAGGRKIRVTTCRRGAGWQTTLVGADERPRLFALLESLVRSDGDLALELTAQDEAALRDVGLLVRPREIPRDVRFELPSAAISAADIAQSELLTARQAFHDRGYVVVPRLVPDMQVAALQRYYRALLDEGLARFGDRQVERRYSVHNESVSRMFLTALMPVVSQVVGAPVKPTYSFFASYREGGVLDEHVDRPQCQFSISFLVDYAPTPEGPSPWPLWVRRDRDQAGVPLRQSIGDGIFYKGCELRHSRTALPAGHRSTHVFFHYVPADFAGPLD